MNITVAIDFDGVIHRYSKGWKDGSIYDKPIEGSIKSLNNLLKEGFSVFILSTRSSKQIKKWLKQYSNPLIYMSQSSFYDQYAPFQNKDTKIINDEYENLSQLQYPVKIVPFYKKFWSEKNIVGITHKKLPAHIYIDDRGYKFDNWKDTLIEIESLAKIELNNSLVKEHKEEKCLKN